MFHIIIKPAALSMLDEAYSWYEHELTGLGERFLQEMDIAFNKLSTAPLAYSFLQENYRQLLLKRFPYKVIFEIIKNEVVVYAIFHTARSHRDSFLD